MELLKEKTKQKPISIIEYVQNEMDDFFTKPFSEVDSLVLAQLSYLHVERIVGGLQENKPDVSLASLFRAELFEAMLHEVRDSKSNKELLFAVCASPRFRTIQANYYVNHVDEAEEKQFCAITFQLPTGKAYVAFRGTDTTVVGWKEDFNMMFITPVPSQEAAVEYLNLVADKINGPLLLGGHSKGGNLAVYSAVYCNNLAKSRVEKIFSHDGPGFPARIVNSPQYQHIASKIHATMPQTAIVGMLFEGTNQYKVVKSNRLGIMQHDPFSWEIKGSQFDYTPQVAQSAIYMDQALNTWIETLSPQQRRVFVDTLFSIFEATSAKSFAQFPQTALKEADLILQAVKNIDQQTAECIKMIVGEFIKIWVKSMLSLTDFEPLNYEKLLGKNKEIIKNPQELQPTK